MKKLLRKIKRRLFPVHTIYRRKKPVQVPADPFFMNEHINSYFKTLVNALPETAEICDVGCGERGFEDFGIRYENLKHKILATDIEKKRVFPPNVTFVKGDIHHIDIDPERFDLIVANHVMEHFEAPAEIMKKIWRWLKPGGCFFMVVPDGNAFSEVFHDTFFRQHNHINRFTGDEYAAMASACGFTEKHRLNRVFGWTPFRDYLVGRQSLQVILRNVVREYDKVHGTSLCQYGWAFDFRKPKPASFN